MAEENGPSAEETVTHVFRLSKSSCAELLRRYPPRFTCVLADHITYQSKMPPDAPLPPRPGLVRVLGYAGDEALEALVAEVDGTTRRPDGGTYHITLSLEPDKRRAQDSNSLLQAGWDEWPAFEIEVTPEADS